MTEKKLDWDKPFEAFLESGAVLNARLLSSDYKHDSLTYRVVQVERGNHSAVYTYHENGTPRYNGEAPPLRNKTRKVTRWLNLYNLAPGVKYFLDADDAEQAGRETDSFAHGRYLKTISVELEVPCD